VRVILARAVAHHASPGLPRPRIRQWSPRREL